MFRIPHVKRCQEIPLCDVGTDKFEIGDFEPEAVVHPGELNAYRISVTSVDMFTGCAIRQLKHEIPGSAAGVKYILALKIFSFKEIVTELFHHICGSVVGAFCLSFAKAFKRDV